MTHHTQSTRGHGHGGHSHGHGHGHARGRGTPTGTQSHDNCDKSSPSTSIDNIQCSSYGRQIKKKIFDDLNTCTCIHVYICNLQ